MLQRIRLLLLLLALVCWLPSAAFTDEEKDDPKPGENKPEEGKPEEPPKDPPAEGEDPPAEGEGEKKEGEPEDTEGEGEKKEGEAEKKEGEAPAPPAGRAKNEAVAPIPVPAGMVYLEGGRVWVGSEPAYLNRILEGRPPDIRKLFLYETPHHTVFLRPYFISKYELANAQYQRFLEHAVATYDTASGSLANLDEIAAHLVRLSKDQQKNPRQVVWLQLYFANKEAVWKAFEARLAEFQVKRPDGSVDEERTARKFRFEPLPRTLKLKFYTRRPPADWRGMTPPKGEESRPVRFVSYNDAEAFAEWAGVHIPTEYEWEWAARGPGSPVFPWGDDWPLDESLAVWGGKVIDSRYETRTENVNMRYGFNPLLPNGKTEKGKEVPVDGDGRSWCGCHHMVGNVAEWTSSWFEPYRLNRFGRHNKMGWVKVIRGGSAADGEMLALRPACRNYIGAGADAPPFPENSFEWCGFRVSSYMKSGLEQLGPVVRRAVRPKKIKKEHLALDGYIGSVTRDWVEPGAEPENHVYFLGRSHSIILIPNKIFLREEGMEVMKSAWKRPAGYKTARGIKRKTESNHPEWVIGVLHTDIPLEPVDVRKPIPEEEEEKKSGRRRRGRAKIPELMDGRCPPGTYLLGIWFGRLALLDPTMDFVCFIPKRKGEKSNFNVKKVKPEEIQPSSIAVDAELDWADLRFAMPLGGKSVDEKIRLIVSARLQFEVGSLEAAGKWIQEDPGKEVYDRVWAEWLEAEKQAASGKKPKPTNGKPKPNGDNSANGDKPK